MNTNGMPLFLLRDLVMINIARIDKYQQIKRSGERLMLDLTGILSDMIQESKVYQQELTEKIHQLDGVSLQDKKPGDVYNLWQEEQAYLKGRDRQSFLNFCEKEEQALQHAYQTVLIHTDRHEDIQYLLEQHQSDIENELEHLQKYRKAQ